MGEPYIGLAQAQNHRSPGKQYSVTSLPLELAVHQSGTAGTTHVSSSWAELPMGWMSRTAYGRRSQPEKRASSNLEDIVGRLTSVTWPLFAGWAPAPWRSAAQRTNWKAWRANMLSFLSGEVRGGFSRVKRGIFAGVSCCGLFSIVLDVPGGLDVFLIPGGVRIYSFRSTRSFVLGVGS